MYKKNRMTIKNRYNDKESKAMENQKLRIQDLRQKE